jgi:hypothetical protein
VHVFHVTDINEALPRALAYLRDCGTVETTRNGPALVAPGPVATVYREPRRRVLFDAVRDANPFFHMFEALWILAGRQDVRTLSWFNSRMAEYSDDGITFHAPYGYRLRRHFSFDQIDSVVSMLRADPYSRRAVLQIWDCKVDIGVRSKDIPCNDMVMLRVRNEPQSFHPSGKSLDITVCCRSNDAVWGAYGANAVQFSMLQEYLAGRIGVGVGEYTQMSHNLHVYTENPYWQAWEAMNPRGVYVADSPYVLRSSPADTSQLDGIRLGRFDDDLRDLFDLASDSESVQQFSGRMLVHDGFRTVFFRDVARPMLAAYGQRQYAEELLKDSWDWHRAGIEWVRRRNAKVEK